ncbi:hypothetical protein RYX36_003192 [Vicia faba]
MNKISPHSFQDVYDKESRQIRNMHRFATLYKPLVYFKSVAHLTFLGMVLV